MAIPVAIVRKVLSGELPMAFLRSYVMPVARATPTGLQLSLWVVDQDGLAARPWKLDPALEFRCQSLGCTLKVGTCVLRQQISDAQRTRTASRGQGTQYPHCVTERCAQGRGIRLALGPGIHIPWSGIGQGKRLQAGLSPQQKRSQREAQARQQAAGLLDEVTVLDVDEDPNEHDW